MGTGLDNLMESLSISLFGEFCAKCDGKIVGGLESRKVQELLCFLLLNSGRSHTRETLANLLWTGTELSQSKRYLSKTLWKLQAAIESETRIERGRVLYVDNQAIQINLESYIWVDIVAFEHAHAICSKLQEIDVTEDRFSSIERAVQLYRGDLLEGWYHPWCIYERERFRLMLTGLLDRSVEYLARQRRYDEAAIFCLRSLGHEPARERTHRQLMRLYYLVGDRTAALRQYEQCAAILQDELGVEPGRYTQALFQQICEDKPAFLMGLDAVKLPSTSMMTANKPAIRIHLQRIHAILSDTQRCLAEEIDAIESLLKQ